jgi:hypothetical protein
MQRAYVLNVLEPLQAFQAQKEGGNGVLTLRIHLCDDDTHIRFMERHIMNLHVWLKVAATSVFADVTLGT